MTNKKKTVKPTICTTIGATMFLNSVFFNKVSKIGFAVSINIEENIEEKINALPFLNVIIFQKNEKMVFIIIEIIFFQEYKKNR